MDDSQRCTVLADGFNDLTASGSTRAPASSDGAASVIWEEDEHGVAVDVGKHREDPVA